MMSPLATTATDPGKRRSALNVIAGSLWHIPGSFSVARALGSGKILRVVLFHHIADAECSFTKGLGITVSRGQLETALKFITNYYTPVSLEDVIAATEGGKLPPRPVLVTFDDAYASVNEVAAPLCFKFGVPAVFFVNGALLDNRRLALENLVSYVANVHGLEAVNIAIRAVEGSGAGKVRSLAEVFSDFLPQTSLSGRQAFHHSLIDSASIDEAELAARTRLYVSREQLREFAKFNFELGNHTFTHTNCRTLSAKEFVSEIDTNREFLEAVSGTRVRSFSVPFGSSADLTAALGQHLRQSGYKAVFLAEGVANAISAPQSCLDRVSIKASSEAALFSEIEVLPRLRNIRTMVRRMRLTESHSTHSQYEIPARSGPHTTVALQPAIPDSRIEISQ
jgi:peptidoglycan/xylan/chitin deacetylase (PgdA/CDA1 family)